MTDFTSDVTEPPDLGFGQQGSDEPQQCEEPEAEQCYEETKAEEICPDPALKEEYEETAVQQQPCEEPQEQQESEKPQAGQPLEQEACEQGDLHLYPCTCDTYDPGESILSQMS